jgi:hypothetical protein
MVKRFFYMLALAFALQMSAGVASAYCMHETGKASEHFGHHQHKHQDAAGDEDSSAPAKKAGPDPDCASCSHGTSVSPSWSSNISQHLLPAHQQLAQLPSRPTPYFGLPERPNWMVAV